MTSIIKYKSIKTSIKEKLAINIKNDLPLLNIILIIKYAEI